ncbi:MAG: MoaD/ThiS family protein [Planctomycetaceae bacterium]|nr:MAG: MoaD/ThiS family protein [Planctomycetaceae bacterium]
MRVKVRIYATLCRYIPGVSAGTPVEIELSDGASVSNLVEKLKIPAREVKIAFVNGRIRPLDWLLESGDEMGIFPPIGGG